MTLDNIPIIEVERNELISKIRNLYSAEGYTFLTDLCGIHVTEPAERLGVVYHLHNLQQNKRVRIKSFAPKDDPVFPSLTVLFQSANWMERETYDFFGINFTGHPNLIRILNMEDMTYFPMRKEYPLEEDTRIDKDDTMFGR